jgi:3-hydroxybutyryl-CoA dehydrogenase
MGGGIAETAILRGFSTILYDVGDEILARARDRIRADVERQVQRRRLTPAESEEALGRLALTTRLEDLNDADLIIEAAPEDLDLKRTLFAAIDRIARPDAIFASNTSSLSITALAGGTGRPERVVGMHFFNPAPVMPLVEVVPGRRTAPEVLTEATALARALGKAPVVARDTPGFIVNRIARPYYTEALRLLAEGVVSVEEIDRIMRLAGGFRMGPFELLDLIGLDVNLAVTRSIYEAFFQEPRYRPHPLQEQMVQAGLLGRKSGRGFYVYDEGRAGASPAPPFVVTTVPTSDTPPAPPGAATTAPAPPPAAPATRASARVAIVGEGPLAEDLMASARTAGWAVEMGSPEAPGEVDLVVDLLLDVEAKARLWKELDSRIRPDAVRLTLALSASVTEIAAASRFPDAVVGFATLPPWGERSLVEVIAGLRSSTEACAITVAALEDLGKETSLVRDGAGGVFPRIFAMIVNEAAFALAEGVARPEDIDTALRLGANYPRGPLALADEIGLQTILAVIEGLQRETGEDRYRPAPFLRKMVAAGWTGREAGRGFVTSSGTHSDGSDHA